MPSRGLKNASDKLSVTRQETPTTSELSPYGQELVAAVRRFTEQELERLEALIQACDVRPESQAQEVLEMQWGKQARKIMHARNLLEARDESDSDFDSDLFSESGSVGVSGCESDDSLFENWIDTSERFSDEIQVSGAARECCGYETTYCIIL
jgi:hypothetical protein